MADDPRSVAAWKARATEAEEQVASLRRENARLAQRLSEVLFYVYELLRDLQFHQQRMRPMMRERGLHVGD